MDNFIDRFSQRKNAQEMIRANAMAEAEEKAKMTARLSEYEAAMQELRRCNLLNMESAEKVKELLAAGLRKIEEVQKRDVESFEKPAENAGEVRILLESLKDQVTEILDGQQRQMREILGEQQSRLREILGEQQSRLKEVLDGQQRQTTELLGRQQGRTAETLEKQQERMTELLTEQNGRVTELLTEQKNQMAELLREQSARFEEQRVQAKEQEDFQKKAIEGLFQDAGEFNHKEAVKVYRNVQAFMEGALPKQTEEIAQAVEGITKKGKMPVALVIVWVLTFLAAAGNIVMEILKMLGYL